MKKHTWLACIWLASTLMMSCVPVFVTATPRVVGQASGQRPTDGYLKIDVTSNFDAFSTEEYQGVASGYAYLSVSVTPANANTPQQASIAQKSAPEYPLLLLDLKSRKMSTVTGIRISRGEFVNFDSAIAPKLTFTIRAIPKTIATAYAEMVNSMQELVSGIPLSQVAQSNPYLAMAGKLLGNLASVASDSKNPTTTEAIVGVSQSSANTSPLPLDGTPVALILRRTDSQEPLPNPGDLSVCKNNPGTVCESKGATDNAINKFPYLIIKAVISDYRPNIDWTDETWNCPLSQKPEKLQAVEADLIRATFTAVQQKSELAMLGRAKALASAYAMTANLDLKQPANIAAYANIMRAWRLAGDNAGTHWDQHYKYAAETLEDCFKREMKRRSQQHETAYGLLEKAFNSAQEFRARTEFSSPMSENEKKQTDTWLTNITNVINYLQVRDGETYGAFRADQDAIEQLLIKEDRRLASEFINSTSNRVTLRLRIDERLRSPCESCRAVLNEAIAQVNIAEANAARLVAQREVEQARKELIDARQQASQLAVLATSLQSSNQSVSLSRLQAALQSVETATLQKTNDKNSLTQSKTALDIAAAAVKSNLQLAQ